MMKLATYEDIPRVVDLVMNFIANSPYSNEANSVEKVTATIEHMVRDRSKGIVVLYVVDDEPVGLIGGVATEMVFSHDVVATELFWWVDPEFRSRKSLALKEAFEYWARRIGAKFVSMSSLDERVGRFYERSGYRKVENAYLRTL